MACKDVTDYAKYGEVDVGNCITWAALKLIRLKANELFDKVGIPADGQKYGGDDDFKEEIEDLATITDAYFKITFGTDGLTPTRADLVYSGSLSSRVGSAEYTYNTSTGQWYVYLKDGCFGCTGFKFEKVSQSAAENVNCGGTTLGIPYYEGKNQLPLSTSIDPISETICNLQTDWRSDAGVTKLYNLASGLFPATLCTNSFDESVCTNLTQACCEFSAAGHYTRTDSTPCGFDEEEDPQYPYRLAYVTLHMGGVEGYVTQSIKSTHLSDIKDRIDVFSANLYMEHAQPDECDNHACRRPCLYDDIAHTATISGDWEGTECTDCNTTYEIGEDICACNWLEMYGYVKWLFDHCDYSEDEDIDHDWEEIGEFQRCDGCFYPLPKEGGGTWDAADLPDTIEFDHTYLSSWISGTATKVGAGYEITGGGLTVTWTQDTDGWLMTVTGGDSFVAKRHCLFDYHGDCVCWLTDYTVSGVANVACGMDSCGPLDSATGFNLSGPNGTTGGSWSHTVGGHTYSGHFELWIGCSDFGTAGTQVLVLIISDDPEWPFNSFAEFMFQGNACIASGAMPNIMPEGGGGSAISSTPMTTEDAAPAYDAHNNLPSTLDVDGDTITGGSGAWSGDKTGGGHWYLVYGNYTHGKYHLKSTGPTPTSDEKSGSQNGPEGTYGAHTVS